MKVSTSFVTLRGALCVWLATEDAQDTSQEFLKMPISRTPHRFHGKIFFVLCAFYSIAYLRRVQLNQIINHNCRHQMMGFCHWQIPTIIITERFPPWWVSCELNNSWSESTSSILLHLVLRGNSPRLPGVLVQRLQLDLKTQKDEYNRWIIGDQWW